MSWQGINLTKKQDVPAINQVCLTINYDLKVTMIY